MAYTSPSITASGLTFAQFQAAGASGHLEALIAAQTGTANPTVAPTLAASGSGSTLPVSAGYYCVVSESNGLGETLAGPVSAGQAITSGLDLVVTFPTLKAGNVSRNTYVGTNIAGPFALASTGVTAATVTFTAPVPMAPPGIQPPTVNTTGLTRKKLELLRSFKDGNADEFYLFLRSTITSFNTGQPVSFPEWMTKLHDAHTVLAILSTMVTEAGVLADANNGTLTSIATGIGARKPVRTWP
jgi:hypothetical protein